MDITLLVGIGLPLALILIVTFWPDGSRRRSRPNKARKNNNRGQ